MIWFSKSRLFAVLLFSCAGLFVATHQASPASAEVSRITADSLQSLLEKALAAFAQNDFSAAAEFFLRLENDFGSEPEYQDSSFLQRLLPLKGHAELAAGLPTAAVSTLSQFVENYPTDPNHPEALFALARALQRDNRPENAIARLIQFVQAYPNRPEVPLAQLQRSEILFQTGQPAAALALLDELLHSDAPEMLRHQARLRAVRQALDSGDLPTAVHWLLDFHWNLATTPDLVSLAFTALDLGDRLMEAHQYNDAVRAYRLVPAHSALLELQEAQITRIKAAISEGTAADSPGRRFWNDYFRRLLLALRQQIASLQGSDDYTPALLLRRGQAMLVVDRHHEAWLLFELLALDESLPSSMREEAHYRWILAATGLESWEEALTIARNFLVRYPEAPLAPQALYLIAQAHQEQRRYAEAADILTDLQTSFPDHPLAQRWRFTLGFNRILVDDFSGARSHFRRAVEDYSATQLTANAELWHALTFFFERNYPTALAEFESLTTRYDRHPLGGEIHYRRASTLYAMRDYERAEVAATDFVTRFQGHQRHPEALVLLGDIQMGAGELDQAIATFQQISPDAGPTFLYGLFQQGKILRAQQEFEAMISLFSDYTEDAGSTEKPRLSEALYWIGWAYAQLDLEEEAIPIFHTALERYGNDPGSTEIGSILELLERLHPPPDAPDEEFSTWIETERQQALATGRATYFSRLNLYLAQTKRQQNLPHQAANLLFEIFNLAPIDELGPDALGQVGHILAESDLQAADPIFTRLLKDYPTAPERAFAYHGFGKHHHKHGRHEEALTWLRRFENETPTHSLAPDVLQMTGKTLLSLGLTDEANAKFEEILSLRSMRGRPHAAALIGLAESARAAGEPDRAIAFYQRVFTMHRAQTDLTAEAYYESSRLFEQLDDTPAAHRTLAEMLSLTDLAGSPYYEKAREREAALAPQIAALLPDESE